jgi:nucleotidyltransferase/DNA polymerase involved in DNA repair
VSSVRATAAVWVACFWIENIGAAVEYSRLPHLEGEPLVLAAPDGAVVAVSEEAARWGVTAGITTQSARSLCSDLIVLPYDRVAYEIAARTVWNAIAIESSVVEPVSPEICYAELRGTHQEVVNRLRHFSEALVPCVGMPVRIGLARTKFVAVRAARQSSNEPVIIPLGEEARFLSTLPLSSLPSHPKLDQKAKQQIQRLGIKKLGDIWALPPHRLPKTLQKVGHQLLQWAQGHDSAPVKALWPPRTISVNLRFEDGIEDRFAAENALRELAKEVACQLSTSGEFAREVTLSVGLSNGTFLTETEKLALPESQMAPIYRTALRLLQKLHIEQPVTSLKITAGEVGSGAGIQLSLMDQAGELPHERLKRLEAVLAHLRRRYGPRAVISGSLLSKARRIHLWTYALGHLLSEPLEQVATDERGTPVRYWRRTAGRLSPAEGPHGRYSQQERAYDVVTIHNRWRETRSRQGALIDTEVWRVETDPFGVSELRHLDTEWRLTATWD